MIFYFPSNIIFLRGQHWDEAIVGYRYIKLMNERKVHVLQWIRSSWKIWKGRFCWNVGRGEFLRWRWNWDGSSLGYPTVCLERIVRQTDATSSQASRFRKFWLHVPPGWSLNRISSFSWSNHSSYILEQEVDADASDKIPTFSNFFLKGYSLMWEENEHWTPQKLFQPVTSSQSAPNRIGIGIHEN